MSDDTTAEDIYAVIGTVVARLLKPDQHLTLQDITHALHHLGETASEDEQRQACLNAISMLVKQMH